MSKSDSANARVPRPKFSRRLLRALGLRDPHQDLSAVIAAGEAAKTLEERIVWMGRLIDWVRGSTLSSALSGAEQSVVRFRFLVQLLERHVERRRLVAGIVWDLLRETEAPSLFAQTELTEQGGFFSEALRRVAERAIPPRPRPHELSYTVQVVFTGSDDAEWINAISDEDWLRACQLLILEQAPQAMGKESRLSDDLRDAVVHLAAHATSLGLSEEVRTRVRLSLAAPSGRPFVDLSREAYAWHDAPLGPSKAEREKRLQDAIRTGLEAVHAAYEAVEHHGVSLQLVYRLETITGLLRRMQLLLNLDSKAPGDPETLLDVRSLLVELVRTRTAHRSIGALLNMNFDIFARRLVQSAGETGEHYITRTRAEYWDMFRAAAGGGVLTVGTTLLKFIINYPKLPLFIEGTLTWINYSASFMTMQLLGFTLATKQPSMTAAALARKLSGAINRRQLGEFVEEVARISRSQFIAAVGNVGLVIPGAWIANLIYTAITGHTVLSAEYAAKTIATFHPWKSGSLFYAALTGVLLWLSSFGAGWLENWVIYRGLPDALAGNRGLRAAIGDAKARRVGDWIREHASGIGGNVAIGFLLAFVPVAGRFFGLPFDIRHVTLSAGAMTFAFCALDPSEVTGSNIATAVLGVVLIGIMNFLVSTACALAVAARAQKVRRFWLRAFLAESWTVFVRRPWKFFAPPKE